MHMNFNLPSHRYNRQKYHNQHSRSFCNSSGGTTTCGLTCALVLGMMLRRRRWWQRTAAMAIVGLT